MTTKDRLTALIAELTALQQRTAHLGTDAGMLVTNKDLPGIANGILAEFRRIYCELLAALRADEERQ